MRRNTLALAIAGAFALPAGVMAQSTVQIYGHVRATVENVDSGVPNTGGSRGRVTNPGGSQIGFRGTESLGGGLSAWWQIESNIGGTDGTRADVSTLGGRSTGVGLFGSWGRVIAGNWNSPYKDFAGGQFQPFGATALGGTNSIMQNGDHTGPAPLGVPIAGAQPISVSGLYNSGPSASLTPGGALTTQLVQPNVNSFHRRFRNTVGYRGSFSGFNVGVGYEFAEGEQGRTAPDAWAASLYYANGPLTVGGAYERHNSFASAVVAGVLQDTTDTAWFLGAKYRFGGLELGLGYERLEYDIAGSAIGGAMGNLERKAWQLHADYRFGPHRIGGMWIKADDTSGNAGGIGAGAAATRAGIVGNGGAGSTGADQYTLNYGYSFSKRTEVRVHYARLSNDSAASYDFSAATTGTGLGTGSTGLGGGLNQGRDRKGYGLTITHAF